MASAPFSRRNCATSRDPVTLRFVLIIPILQLLMLGYAINTTVQHVPALVYRGDHGRAAQAFLDALAGSRTFDVVGSVNSRPALRQAIVSGRVRVAFDIPENFTADILAGHRPAVGVLVDGSDSAVAQSPTAPPARSPVSRSTAGDADRVRRPDAGEAIAVRPRGCRSKRRKWRCS